MNATDKALLDRARDKRIRRKLRAHPEYRLRLGDTCPKCGYGVVIEGPVTESGPIDFCFSCQIVWERETRKDPELECCNQCAFLPGSPEQKNPEEWRTIVDRTVKEHGVFLCHKRTPFDIVDGHAHYRHREGGKLLYGTRCHGWLKAKCSVLLKGCTMKFPNGSEIAVAESEDPIR